MKQDEFRNRYIIKVGSSVLIAVFNLIIQLILPRALSVEEYGIYNYNLNVFTSVVVMLNLSTSNALVAKFSKRNEEIGLVNFYLKYFGIVAILLNVAIIILYPLEIFQATFIGQTFFIVLLGLDVAILNKLLTDSVALYDACAISRFPAMMQMILKAIISVIVIIGYFVGKINLLYFYMIQVAVMTSVVLVMLIAILRFQKRSYPQKKDLGWKVYLKEYYIFCKPLVLATVVAQIVIIVMNWALMKWSGTTAQAMFGAAWQFNALISYVFSPYAELSKREFAVLHDNQEMLKVKFLQALRMMMWITSYFAIFIGFAAEWILPIVYGDKYAGAETVTILIMFYTVYQAWGQITGAYMIALEKTKLNAVVAVIGQVLTLLFVFLFQIPNFIWPNSLGEVGIALNYLVANIISTTIFVCAISKDLKLSAIRTWSIQFPPILICTSLTVVLKSILDTVMIGETIFWCIIKTLIAGISYTAIVGLVLYTRPQFIGVSKESLRNLLKIKGRKA